jgi:thioredoxin-related protein
MKKLILFALFFSLNLGLMAQDKEINWLTFEEASELAAKEPKMILVSVYTDWCGWGKKMDKETFRDDGVIDYVNETFYPVKMNAEDNKRKYQFRGREFTDATMARTMRVTSYPNFVVMDAAMENITLLPGYREPQAFLTSINSLLEKFNP